MELTHQETVAVNAPVEAVYRLVSDVTRTGEWSPTCRGCTWEDPEQRGLGARFTGDNETPARRWSTTSTVVAAEPGEEFAWEVGRGFVRWGYLLSEREGGTQVTQTWEFTEAGQEFFHKQYGDDAQAQMDQRTTSARDDMPRTLAAIKEIAEREHTG
ncbi:MAG: polyketide cyclase [Arsenicicoccus sp.]|nr:MAG: polyketide cyclase [Arsenicicoccus sp.]